MAAFFYGENHPYLFRFSEAADGLLTDAPHALERLAPRFGHALRDDLRRDGSHALEEADGIERLEGLDRNRLERPLRVLADERRRLHDGQARKAERLHVPLDDALELHVEERRACIGTSRRDEHHVADAVLLREGRKHQLVVVVDVILRLLRARLLLRGAERREDDIPLHEIMPAFRALKINDVRPQLRVIDTEFAAREGVRTSV